MNFRFKNFEQLALLNHRPPLFEQVHTWCELVAAGTIARAVLSPKWLLFAGYWSRRVCAVRRAPPGSNWATIRRGREKRGRASRPEPPRASNPPARGSRSSWCKSGTFFWLRRRRKSPARLLRNTTISFLGFFVSNWILRLLLHFELRALRLTRLHNPQKDPGVRKSMTAAVI